MQLIVQAHFQRRRRCKARFCQIALWLAMTILVLQLVGMAFHNHGLAEESDDCVSCNLAAAFPAPAPAPPVVAPLPIPVFVYYVALEPAYSFVRGANSYLIPYSHAPPGVFSPL